MKIITMKKYKILVPVLFFIIFLACKNIPVKEGNIYNNIPSLEELSGVWVSIDSVDMEPSIRNFRGQASVNRDMTSVSWFVSAPYSGGYHTGTLKINGKTPKLSTFRWQPYQALRRGKLGNLDIQSSTRMFFDKDAIMWQVEITNSDSVN
jgi:hypothetical protein